MVEVTIITTVLTVVLIVVCATLCIVNMKKRSEEKRVQLEWEARQLENTRSKDSAEKIKREPERGKRTRKRRKGRKRSAEKSVITVLHWALGLLLLATAGGRKCYITSKRKVEIHDICVLKVKFASRTCDIFHLELLGTRNMNQTAYLNGTGHSSLHDCFEKMLKNDLFNAQNINRQTDRISRRPFFSEEGHSLLVKWLQISGGVLGALTLLLVAVEQVTLISFMQ
ncbi:hypothetical protein Q1695_004660 [Nippostrongylus brasiliensis]|nr:hypothetical protein Q1695_004660 [Nippostrongylus brasiliensis]